MSTILWGILVLVTLYAGLVIYLACRKDERSACPVCGSYPPVSFNFCPCCGSVLGASCPVLRRRFPGRPLLRVLRRGDTQRSRFPAVAGMSRPYLTPFIEMSSSAM